MSASNGQSSSDANVLVAYRFRKISIRPLAQRDSVQGTVSTAEVFDMTISVELKVSVTRFEISIDFHWIGAGSLPSNTFAAHVVDVCYLSGSVKRFEFLHRDSYKFWWI